MTNERKQTSIASKILWIVGSFSLPIAVLVYLMVGSINESIQFGQKELEGAKYLRPLAAVQKHVQDYWLSDAACHGQAACQAQSEFARKAVLDDLDELDAADRKYGVSLQFTAEGLAKRGREHMRPQNLREEWLKFVALPVSDPHRPESFAKVVAMARTMITHAGDSSNLILDPDLDTYYMMDAVLLALPSMQDRVSQVTVAAAHAGANPSERFNVAVDAALLKQADFDRTILSVETSLNEDPQFYGVSEGMSERVKPVLQRFTAANTNFTDLVHQASVEGLVVQPAVIWAAGEQARRTVDQLWNAGMAELEIMLWNRISTMQGRRTRALLISLLALLAACGLAFYLSRTITSPLELLVRSLGPAPLFWPVAWSASRR